MTTTSGSTKTVPGPVRTPPGKWIRDNLFRGPRDAVITLVFGTIAVVATFLAVRFVFFTGRWEIVQVNLKLLLVGRWPLESLDRLAVALVAVAGWGGLVAGIIAGRQIRAATWAPGSMGIGNRVMDLGRRFGLITATILLLLLLTTTVGPWQMVGASVGLGLAGYWVGRTVGRQTLGRLGGILTVLILLAIPVAIFIYLIQAVALAEWEGFLFNLVAAVAGIVLCFPLGVLLALGRRSQLPLIKSVAVGYIEAVRGSPLFVLLLLANVSLEFFVPPDIAPSKVIRAIVTFTLFTAAYLAEIVRGGLQSVPRGQEEAAKALGLSPTRQMAMVILPQALRAVIPAQIGQFISLFKDTVLAGAALGILDMLAVAEVMTKQPDFLGQELLPESLVFIGFLFWVGSFTMSRESQRLERRLGVGTR